MTKIRSDNAKAEIDGKDYGAYRWELVSGPKDMTAVISCRIIDGESRLTLKDNPKPGIRLVDCAGTKLDYFTQLIKVEQREELGSHPVIEYFFKILA